MRLPIFSRQAYRHRKKIRELRKISQARLASIGLPGSYDLVTVQAHLSRARGRPIHLVPVPMKTSGACGLWLSFRDAEYIAYEANTSQHHQEHIIAHELAHIICGHHSGIDAGGEGMLPQLFPDLDPSLLRDLLYRDNCSEAQEQEAEMLASILLAHPTHPRRNAPDNAIDRAGHVLGIHD